MTNKEQINRNIGLAFDFVRHLISKPEDADKLPEEFELEFIEKDFNISSDLNGENKKLVKVKNAFEVID